MNQDRTCDTAITENVIPARKEPATHTRAEATEANTNTIKFITEEVLAVAMVMENTDSQLPERGKVNLNVVPCSSSDCTSISIW